MRNKYLVLLSIFLVLSLSAGCAAQGKNVSKAKPVKKKVAMTIKMEPKIEIKVTRFVKKVYVEEFKNKGKHHEVGIVFTNALVSKLMDKGFEIVQDKNAADLYFEGAVLRSGYETPMVGIFRSVGRQLAYGKEGVEHLATLVVDVKIGSGDETLSTKITGETRTYEQEEQSGLNDISLKIADRLVAAVKIRRD